MSSAQSLCHRVVYARVSEKKTCWCWYLSAPHHHDDIVEPQAIPPIYEPSLPPPTLPHLIKNKHTPIEHTHTHSHIHTRYTHIHVGESVDFSTVYRMMQKNAVPVEKTFILLKKK